MFCSTYSPRAAAALLGFALSLVPIGPVTAGAADYAFQAASPTVSVGKEVVLEVKLIHVPTAKPVAGAVIFKTRLDMGPDGMPGMTAKHVAVQADQPGTYRFMAAVTMAGGWALNLAAKVPGETETVQGVVRFQASD